MPVIGPLWLLCWHSLLLRREQRLPRPSSITVGGASWMNMIECFFTILTKQVLTRSVQFEEGVKIFRFDT